MGCLWYISISILELETVKTTIRASDSSFSNFLQAASSLACAQRGWMNVDVDRIACESCGACLSFVPVPTWTPVEGS